MVSVEYNGRLGNRMFQYAFGRLVAEGLGYRLNAAALPEFAATAEAIDGESFAEPIIRYSGHDRPDLPALLADKSPRGIIAAGYFQQARYYHGQRERIAKWFSLPRIPGAGADDCVIHLRLGDYRNLRWVLPADFYLRCLDRERFDRLHIVTDEPQSDYLAVFSKYRPVVAKLSVAEALAFLASARKLILSQSSFSWWGAYLGQARRIYFPVPVNSLWGEGSPVDLRVDDPRYEYVATQVA